VNRQNQLLKLDQHQQINHNLAKAPLQGNREVNLGAQLGYICSW